MYRELIEQYSQGNKWVKIQAAATKTQIETAEQIVGFRFPSELKDLLTELNGDKWLFFSTEEISETSQVVREAFKDCYPDIDKHIFFAGNGCGDYYCYNVNSAGAVDYASIFIWEHEVNETKKVASNLQELIKRYYNGEI